MAALTAEHNRIQHLLSHTIHLSDRLHKAAIDSVYSQKKSLDFAKQADHIATLLRSIVRIATTNTAGPVFPIYDRPILRISADVSRNLNRSISILRRRRLFFFRLVSSADFRKSLSLLDASSGDLRWLLSILTSATSPAAADGGAGIILSLPPIASNDPILSWVWSLITSVQIAPPPERTEAAAQLGSLALDSDRNKKIIVEEGGIPPLLRLFKERILLDNPKLLPDPSGDCSFVAAVALYNIINNQEHVRVIVDNLGIPLIVGVLSDSPMRVRIKVANLVGKMAELDSVAKEEFAIENVISPLVSLLSFEAFEGEGFCEKLSFHSAVLISNERERGRREGHRLSSKPSSKGGQTRKERESEDPEVKREAKISCARALWMLARDSVSNSRKITETKGLLCLARLIERENGELQKNCLMAVMEITSVADLNADLRRSTFKSNSPAAKAVVEQLLRVIMESKDPSLKIAGLKSIGSLSRTFPARETRVIKPLVDQLSNEVFEVATEAAIALGKFACPDNFLCKEHSKAIVEFSGVLPLFKLLRAGERAQVHGLVLLCYLALHASDNPMFEQERVLNTLAGVQSAQMPHLKELITQAMNHLILYRNHSHPLRQPSFRIP